MKKLGVMDSGYGGLSVVGDMLLQNDEIEIVYFADFQHSPYGDLSKDAVKEYVKEAVESLFVMGADAVLLACNTATSVAVDSLRANFSKPIFGMEPAIKPAILNSQGGEILVLATSLTLKEDRYLSLKNRIDPMDRAVSVPCPGLATLIDHGETRKALEYVAKILNHPRHLEISSVVLGCTHYVLLEDWLLEWFPTHSFFHGNTGTVRHVLRSLGLKDSDPPTVRKIESRIEAIQFITNTSKPGFLEDAREWILYRISKNITGQIYAK